MANTTKKTNQENAVQVNKVDTVKNENEELKKQLEDLKAQMELMSKMMGNNQPIASNSSNKERTIEFINLVPGNLVLKGSMVWIIEGQYNSRTFFETEAKQIVNNMPNTVRGGLVYIDDAQFVQDCNLTEVYRHILSDDQMKTLLEKGGSAIIESYKMVNDGQKKVIIDTIIDKKTKGEFVDGNVLIELGKLSGKDLVSIEVIED